MLMMLTVIVATLLASFSDVVAMYCMDCDHPQGKCQLLDMERISVWTKVAHWVIKARVVPRRRHMGSGDLYV